ncbi:hypothetical protein DITRI_Ditri06bG0114500 [Diplodiscus trichospermus]
MKATGVIPDHVAFVAIIYACSHSVDLLSCSGLISKAEKFICSMPLKPDENMFLHDVGDDEKRDMLCGYSERLAIAFGLLNSKPELLADYGNHSVCGDCHTVTKYISMIMQREILVRDAYRFHIFEDGTCSCGDHWQWVS